MEEIIPGKKIKKNDTAQGCSIFSEKVQSPIWPGDWFALPKWVDFAETFHLGEAHLADPGQGEKLICNNCVETVKHHPPAYLGQSTPDFQIDIPSVTKGSFFQMTLCV